MTASNQIFLVVDAGTPVAAFTARQELKAYLRRRLDVFIKPAGLHVLGQSRDAGHHDRRRWRNEPCVISGGSTGASIRVAPPGVLQHS